MHGNRFKKIYRAVFKIFQKELGIEIYSKIITGVFERKNPVLQIVMEKLYKTLTASKDS